MTRDEAQAEARRRWGSDGYAWTDSAGYRVGVIPRDKITGGIIRGRGPTYEAAFADADRRERERDK
jgi:hypothetical protein